MREKEVDLIQNRITDKMWDEEATTRLASEDRARKSRISEKSSKKRSRRKAGQLSLSHHAAVERA